MHKLDVGATEVGTENSISIDRSVEKMGYALGDGSTQHAVD